MFRDAFIRFLPGLDGLASVSYGLWFDFAVFERIQGRSVGYLGFGDDCAHWNVKLVWWRVALGESVGGSRVGRHIY